MTRQGSVYEKTKNSTLTLIKKCQGRRRAIARLYSRMWFLRPPRRNDALGQKRTLSQIQMTSALPPKADVDRHGHDVRYVPKADPASQQKILRVARLRGRTFEQRPRRPSLAKTRFTKS